MNSEDVEVVVLEVVIAINLHASIVETPEALKGTSLGLRPQFPSGLWLSLLNQARCQVAARPEIEEWADELGLCP